MRKELVERIDYSSIQQYIIRDNDCRVQAYNAREFGFNTVVAGATSVPYIREIIKDSDIKIAGTVSYPSGAYTAEFKVQEINDLLEYNKGIDEIYVVMAVGRYLSGYIKEAKNEIVSCVKAAGGRTVKLVIEAAVMSRQQKEVICSIAKEAGVDYIVSSTGFKPYDIPFPTIDDIRELVDVSQGVKIIACGGIDSLEKVQEMIDAGVDRICTDKAYEIYKEMTM